MPPIRVGGETKRLMRNLWYHPSSHSYMMEQQKAQIAKDLGSLRELKVPTPPRP
jgi:hypothetical protein